MVEGCLADMAIKPKKLNINEWLPIQLKTNNTLNVKQYSFNLKKRINIII